MGRAPGTDSAPPGVGWSIPLLSAGLAASAIVERNGRRSVAGEFAPGARIDLPVKDAALARELCDGPGLRLPVLSQARASLERPLEARPGDQDLAALIRALREAPRSAEAARSA